MESDMGNTSVVREGILFGLGNPLLDISAEVTKEFLEKYDMKSDCAILAEEKHKAMYQDLVNNFPVEYVPGGSCPNTLRVTQWLLGVPKACAFIGCIGRDEFGRILEDRTTAAGVHVQYQYSDTEPTGTCAVLITSKGAHRSLCAYLAAAQHFTSNHLTKPENWALVEKAKFIYLSSYPLTVCPDAMLTVAQHASSQGKLFIMNLSAEFLCRFFKEPMMKLFPHIDILFGNEAEARVFAEEQNLGTTDIREIALKIASLPKQNGLHGRRVIITRGPESTIVVEEGKAKEYAVIHTDPKDIIDCNGAGDAFAGGFLAALVQGHDVDECIRCANYAANLIIQRSGCSLPEKPAYKIPYF